MKIYLYIIIVIICIGCTNVKSVYKVEPLDNKSKSVQYILEKFDAQKENKSIVYFTSGFEGDTIELVNGNDILFKLPIETIEQIGLAHLKTVDNNKEVRINILSTKTIRIVLNKIELKKYKFVYITKDISKKNKYFIEYSNLQKEFY